MSYKLSVGGTLLDKHLQGMHLTRGQAIKAKCCECMCYYEDGKNNCNNPACPLYPYMPYHKGIDNDPPSLS
jgi:hypothetical protein